MVYSDTKATGAAAELLSNVLDENALSYSCGKDLDLGLGLDAATLAGKLRPFARVTIGCHSPLEVQVYSSGVYPPDLMAITCGWCGLLEGQPARDEGEATLPLPVCPPCFLQHKSARSAT